MEMGRKEIGGREWGEEKGKMRGEEESWGKGERRKEKKRDWGSQGKSGKWRKVGGRKKGKMRVGKESEGREKRGERIKERKKE